MRSLTVWIVGLAASAGLLWPSSGNAATDVTVKGEVVEIACSLSKGQGGRGAAHASCALDCAKRGEPLAVLTDDGLYVLTGDFAANRNARLLDFVAKSVTASGTLTERDGNRLLNVKTIRVN